MNVFLDVDVDILSAAGWILAENNALPFNMVGPFVFVVMIWERHKDMALVPLLAHFLDFFGELARWLARLFLEIEVRT